MDQTFVKVVTRLMKNDLPQLRYLSWERGSLEYLFITL